MTRDARMSRLTPKSRTPGGVYKILNPVQRKLENSKSPVWRRQTEPRAMVGVLTVPFSGRIFDV